MEGVVPPTTSHGKLLPPNYHPRKQKIPHVAMEVESVRQTALDAPTCWLYGLPCLEYVVGSLSTVARVEGSSSTGGGSQGTTAISLDNMVTDSANIIHILP